MTRPWRLRFEAPWVNGGEATYGNYSTPDKARLAMRDAYFDFTFVAIVNRDTGERIDLTRTENT